MNSQLLTTTNEAANDEKIKKYKFIIESIKRVDMYELSIINE
jgi:hypothetical protein